MKKTKLPPVLYHFTTAFQYRIILATGKIKTTASNLKLDKATLHYEPIYFNGQVVGKWAVDKYKDYHPVVWLTANGQVTAENTGLSEPKLECRITIKTNGKTWRYLSWRAFCDKYHADKTYTSALKQTANDYQNWYVCESEVPVSDFWKVEFLDKDGTYKEEKDIPDFSLTDIASEIFNV